MALLGARMSVDLLIELGWVTDCSRRAGGRLHHPLRPVGARLLGRGWRLGLLTGGSVAICGASAAMAIAAVLPRNEHSERNLIFTVLSVTVLVHIAMIVYPILCSARFRRRATGIFLGATIHDVAQVVGAGFSVSEESGKTATLVKLIRVALLAPVVLVFSLCDPARNGFQGRRRGKRPPLVPSFVLGFLALAALNSLAILPAAVSSTSGRSFPLGSSLRYRGRRHEDLAPHASLMSAGRRSR